MQVKWALFICFHSLRCGPLIDLCRGPHVRHTGKIKTIKIHKVSAEIQSWILNKYIYLWASWARSSRMVWPLRVSVVFKLRYWPHSIQLIKSICIYCDISVDLSPHHTLSTISKARRRSMTGPSLSVPVLVCVFALICCSFCCHSEFRMKALYMFHLASVIPIQF